jgi:hypothetical protein
MLRFVTFASQRKKIRPKNHMWQNAQLSYYLSKSNLCLFSFTIYDLLNHVAFGVHAKKS